MIGISRLVTYNTATITNLDYDGNVLFTYRIGGSTNSDYLYHGQFTPDGRYFYTGGSFRSNELKPYTDANNYVFSALFKIRVDSDTTPTVEFARQLNKAFNSQTWAFIIDIKNNFILAQNKIQTTTGYWQVDITKF